MERALRRALIMPARPHDAGAAARLESRPTDASSGTQTRGGNAQMFFAAMLVDAFHAALEHRKEVLDSSIE